MGSTIQRHIPQKLHQWFTLRAQEMLRYLSPQSLDQIHAEHIDSYLKALLKRTDLAEWKLVQAIDAIEIFCVDFIGSDQFKKILWDQYRMTSGSINPTHEIPVVWHKTPVTYFLQ